MNATGHMAKHGVLGIRRAERFHMFAHRIDDGCAQKTNLAIGPRKQGTVGLCATPDGLSGHIGFCHMKGSKMIGERGHVDPLVEIVSFDQPFVAFQPLPSRVSQ